MNANTFFRHSGWQWVPPIILLALAAIIWLSGSNQWLFIHLNQLGAKLPDALWAFTTIWGDTLLISASLLPFTRRDPKLLLAILIAALLGGPLVHDLKVWFDQPRPPAVLAADQFHLIGHPLKRFSFPSGHSFTAFTIAAIWIFHRSQATATRLAWLLFAFAVALSRVMVGVHWPVDILVGSALGWLTGIASVRVAHWFQWDQTLIGQRFLLLLFLLVAINLWGEHNGYPRTWWLLDTVSVVTAVFTLAFLLDSWLSRKQSGSTADH